MATTIITKNGSGAPATGDLVQGELAVDLTNKNLYSKDTSGNIVEISARDVSEAPVDGNQYARKDATWTEVVIPDSGIPEAPDDGKLYGRQSEAWTEVVVPDAADPDWSDIQNKPAEFPPSAHNHTITNVTGLQDALDDKADVDHTHEIADVNGLQDALDNAVVVFTLPVTLRSGNAQFPLTADGSKLAVMTRGGELELPLAA